MTMLLIAFKSGGTYAYEGVSSSTVSDFVNALSKGQFFQSNIKNRYVTSKLDDTELETLLGEVTNRRHRKPVAGHWE